jgi:GTPase SAR1 family protein
LDPDFDPSKADFLHLKEVTQKVTDTIIHIHDKRLHVYDMVGIKQAREGWPKYFSQCTCILFFAALDCYDQTMSEDPEMNRMLDTIHLFQNVVDHPALSDVSMILFLNKRDLYEKKVKMVPISKYFPEYSGTIC